MAQVTEGYGHHLEPVDSRYEQEECTQRILSTAFMEAFESDVLARLVTFPDVSQEYALGIRRIQEEYRVFSLSSSKTYLRACQVIASSKRYLEKRTAAGATEYEKELWQRRIEGLEATYRDFEINRCEFGIDASLGAQLVELWRLILLQTRYAANHSTPPGPDKTRGYFHFWSDGKAGGTAYVAEGSNLDLFVGITDTISRLCFTADPSVADELHREADALLARLHNRPN